ncbi:DUF885 domain-containing protein [Spongisporangium articulatum]|uniref:DUF885 domain-containing protein n=1 Tax=Spongisporangium articulatum TaxID=3362603 RepID=A0ABW8ASY4_9ACTN
MSDLFGDPGTTHRFRGVAENVLDALLSARPEWATDLGDHRFDDRLTDWSPDAVATHTGTLADALSALDDVDDTALAPDDRVDLEILRTAVTREVWELAELRAHEWDPLLHLPGDALYPLIAKETGTPAERLRALGARLTAVPEVLEVARDTLRNMPRVHVETAISRTTGVLNLIDADLEPLLAADPAAARTVVAAREPAAAALLEHRAWLEDRLPRSDRDPALGEQAYAARLWYTLDTETGPDALLTRAESDLQAIEERIAEEAATFARVPPRPGLVREVLDGLAHGAPVTDASILDLCRDALAAATARVRELDLVTVPDVGVVVEEMPEIRRGVAVAYCDAPGPLEPRAADVPMIFAVSPTPAGWSPERVGSFYREYNGHMLRDLSVHEGVPGHVLQLAHAARHRAGTRVRAAFRSGPFVEGWAVYAEEMLAEAGLGLGPEVDAGLRMQQLKMQLRSTINAILDIRVHAHGMTEEEARRLMVERGHQEEGEAAGKWRRAQLTSAQLATYYVGYREVSELAVDLAQARPGCDRRQVHDEMLSHGSPPPRHLRGLLALD